MSIPLEELYNFLEARVNLDKKHNIVIYRWKEHGVKKMSDLSPLKATQTWQYLTSVPVICHDQEPLDYEYYSENHIKNYLPRAYHDDPFLCHPASFVELFPTNLSAMFADNFNEYTILVHSDVGGENLNKYLRNKFLGVFFWSQSLIAVDWYRYAQHDPLLQFNTDHIKKDFLIYNRAWTGTREYRLKFAEQLVKHNLQDFCRMSFSVKDGQHSYTDYDFRNANFKIDPINLEDYFPKNMHDSNSSASYTVTDYNESAIEVVLETLFDADCVHLTEKTLRPIACCKPFIIMAGRGSLEFLRKYGFKTFNGLIDESYDTIADSSARMSAILNELTRLQKLNRDEKIQLWQELHKISIYNQNRFFSNDFTNQVIDEFVKNFEVAYNIASLNFTAEKSYRFLNFAKKYIPNFRYEKLFPPVTMHNKNFEYFKFLEAFINKKLN